MSRSNSKKVELLLISYSKKREEEKIEKFDGGLTRVAIWKKVKRVKKFNFFFLLLLLLSLNLSFIGIRDMRHLNVMQKGTRNIVSNNLIEPDEIGTGQEEVSRDRSISPVQ